jgi:Fic family protein
MDPRNFTDSAAGELVPIAEGGVRGWAFVPAPLPREQHLSLRAVNLLGQAENALGRLQGSVGRMVNPYLIARPLLRREAILSSRMEGTRTTAARLVSLEADAVATTDPETREVANYVDAMNHGVALLEHLPLCLRLVRELHEKLLTGVRGAEETPGQERRVQNFIGRADIASARFVPPPPERLEPLLRDFEQYLNVGDSDDGAPLLVRMAMAHYQFETLHPFRDGNGRVGRLLIPLTLLAHGRMTTPTLYVSGYLEQHKRRYVDLMLEASQTGDFVPWTEFFLEALRSAADESSRRADQLIALRERYRDQLHEARSSALTLKLVDALFELPLLTTQRAMSVLEVTAATAGQHLNRLVDANILREVTGRKRDRQFVAPELLAALDTDEEPDDTEGEVK